MANPNAVLQPFRRSDLASVAPKIGTTWYQSGQYYGASFPTGVAPTTSTATSGRSVFTPMTALENAAFNEIAVNVTTAVASATVRLGVFACNADGSVGTALFVSAALDASTTGIKAESCNVQLIAGQTVYIAYLVVGTGVVLTSGGTSAFRAIGGAATAADSYNNVLILSGQSNLVTGAATPLAMAVALVRLKRA